MAIVELFTQTHWSCWCGNLFGASGHPISARVAKEFGEQCCKDCGTSPVPYPTIFSSIARPPLG